ncbi:MAG TPA: polysaccharide biosynthesis C-terminal domain-containing protein [Solirubrobacteraceae bacterium]|jgi:O-antigen/teichoic acid export membrane protein|nr:polysaccharide biosynthesis C-terminal domain-containing protein [Solirubrobacteraceae bacterium]
MSPTSPREPVNPGPAVGELAPVAVPAADAGVAHAAGPQALRGSVLVGGGYAVTIALSLIAAPLLIRHLGIAGFGRYTTVVAIVAVAGGMTDAGLVNIALREWSTRSGADRQRLMRSLLGIRLELSVAGVAAGALFALVAGYDNTLVLGTVIAGVGMMLQTVANVLTVSLQGELRFGWVTIVDIARQAVSVALIVVLVIAGAGLLPFLAVTIPAGLVTLIFTGVLVRGDMPLWPALRGAQWWPLVRDMLPYSAAIALNALYFRVTIIVMSLIATAQQTGYFATSFKVIEVLIGVPGLAIGAAFPILARAATDDRDRFAYACERIIELAQLIGGAVVLAVVLSAPFVIDVLAGAKGAPATPVLQIQALALLATFLAVATSYPLLALRRHVALLIANSIALVMNIALTLVLVPLDQARGAAVAAVVAETCVCGAQLVLLLRLRVGRPRLTSLPLVVVAGLAGATPLLISGLHPLIRMVIGLAIYAAILVAVGRTPPELRHLFERRGQH